MDTLRLRLFPPRHAVHTSARRRADLTLSDLPAAKLTMTLSPVYVLYTQQPHLTHSDSKPAYISLHVNYKPASHAPTAECSNPQADKTSSKCVHSMAA